MALSVFVAIAALAALAPVAAARHLPEVPDTALEGVSIETYDTTPPHDQTYAQQAPARPAQETRIVYKAGSGQSNSITVTENADSYVFTEANAVVPEVADNTGGTCTVAAGVTTCPKAGIDSIAVLAGDESGPPHAGVDDTITVSAIPPQGVLVDGGSGNDEIATAAGNDDVFGREGIDTVSPGAGNDVVTPGPSAQPLAGFRQQAATGGGLGFDEVRFDDRVGGVSVLASQYAKDSDIVNCPTPTATTGILLPGCVDGLTPDFDKIVGTLQNDDIVASTGNNVLAGLDGSDVLCGGMGVDTVDYSESPQGVTVTLDGSVDSDPRHTAPVFEPGLPLYRVARIDCRETDPASGSVVGSPVIGNPLDAPGGPRRDCTRNDGRAGENDCVGEDVESIIGSDFDDTLIGNDPDVFEGLGPKVEPHGTNDIEGRGGDDLIDGRFGPDALSGGAGNDTVTYGAHDGPYGSYAARIQPVSAAIDGAPNDGASVSEQPCVDAYNARLDTYPAPYQTPPDPVTGDRRLELLGGGSLQCTDFDYRSNQSDSIEDDVENVIGGNSADTLGGDGDANRLQGGTGADYIDGHGGGDQLEGQEGADTILGGERRRHRPGRRRWRRAGRRERQRQRPGRERRRHREGRCATPTRSAAATAARDLVDFSEATTPVHVSADGIADDGRAAKATMSLPTSRSSSAARTRTCSRAVRVESYSGGDGDDLPVRRGWRRHLVGRPGRRRRDIRAAGGPVLVNLAEGGNDGEAGEGDDVPRRRRGGARRRRRRHAARGRQGKRADRRGRKRPTGGRRRRRHAGRRAGQRRVVRRRWRRHAVRQRRRRQPHRWGRQRRPQGRGGR